MSMMSLGPDDNTSVDGLSSSACDVDSEDLTLSLVDEVNLTDIEVMPAGDEVGDLCRLLSGPKDAELLCQNLWNVLCCHVGDGIFKDGHNSSRHLIFMNCVKFVFIN